MMPNGYTVFTYLVYNKCSVVAPWDDRLYFFIYFLLYVSRFLLVQFLKHLHKSYLDPVSINLFFNFFKIVGWIQQRPNTHSVTKDNSTDLFILLHFSNDELQVICIVAA